MISSPTPVVVHVAPSGPSWLTLALTLLGTFLAGTATALLIQLYVVPWVERHKRREDRWEHDVRDLHDLLATDLGDMASRAFTAQLMYRERGNLAVTALDPAQLDFRRREAIEATLGYARFVRSRMELLIDRVVSVEPQSLEIARLKLLYIEYQRKAIPVEPLPDDDNRHDEEFAETWKDEGNAREALTDQVRMLANLRHTPRKVRKRWPVSIRKFSSQQGC